MFKNNGSSLAGTYLLALPSPDAIIVSAIQKICLTSQSFQLCERIILYYDDLKAEVGANVNDKVEYERIIPQDGLRKINHLLPTASSLETL